jgi:LmbE family N-acetylglucosaminyl deacetylase
LAAASLLGVKEVRFLNFPDGALEDVYELRLAISREIRRYKPG